MIIEKLKVEYIGKYIKVQGLVEDVKEVLAFCETLTEKGKYKLEEYGKKTQRSPNANAYMWQLCTKIAEVIGSTKEDVYKDAIKEVGVYEDGVFRKAQMEKIQHAWRFNGTGWITEYVGDCKNDSESVIIRFYQGSSTYNTKEMSVLVDYIVGQAKEVNVETRPPNEIERMKQQWGEKAI